MTSLKLSGPGVSCQGQRSTEAVVQRDVHNGYGCCVPADSIARASKTLRLSHRRMRFYDSPLRPQDGCEPAFREERMTSAIETGLLPGTSEIRPEGLAVGGVLLTELGRRFGTPLFVYDEEHLRRLLPGGGRRVRPGQRRLRLQGVPVHGHGPAGP